MGGTNKEEIESGTGQKATHWDGFSAGLSCIGPCPDLKGQWPINLQMVINAENDDIPELGTLGA